MFGLLSEPEQEIYQGITEYIQGPLRLMISSQETVTREVIKSMAQRDILGLSVSREAGGSGRSALLYGMVLEELGRTCPDARSLLTVESSLIAETIVRWGTQSQIHQIVPNLVQGDALGAFALTESSAGSDAGSIETHIEESGASYIISGTKRWITFGAIADFFLVFARHDSGKISALIVDGDNPGVTVRPLSNLLVAEGSYVSDVDFHNVKVPKESVVGAPGTGFLYIANTALDNGRYSVAWGALGLAQAAVEYMTTYALNRRQFGKSLSEFQMIQAFIGKAVAEINTSRSQCIYVANLRDSRHSDAMFHTAIAKYISSQTAVSVARDALHVHGANGFSPNFPVHKILREAQLMEVIEGSNEIQLQVLAREGMRRYRIQNYP